MPTALLGFRPSKRSPLVGWRRVSATAAPTYCLSRAFSTCDKHKLAGRTSRSFWVPVRRESLALPPVLGVSNTGCSLGLLPSRAYRKSCLGRDFAQPPLTRFAENGQTAYCSAPGSQSALTGPDNHTRFEQREQPSNNPHRFLCTAVFEAIHRSVRPSYVFTFSTAERRRPTAKRIRTEHNGLPELARPLEVPSTSEIGRAHV